MRRSRTIVAVGTTALLAICFGAPAVTAQTPSLTFPSLATNTPLTLPSGRVVRRRELVVFRDRNVSLLTVTIDTPVPAADSADTAEEAQEVANLHSAFARAEGIGRIIVVVCRSQACPELPHSHAEMFQFVRVSDGTWTIDLKYAP